jgi:hypothetical protein
MILLFLKEHENWMVAQSSLQKKIKVFFLGSGPLDFPLPKGT